MSSCPKDCTVFNYVKEERAKTSRQQLFDLIANAGTIENALTELAKFLDGREIQILNLISNGTYEEAMEPITKELDRDWRDLPENADNAKL